MTEGGPARRGLAVPNFAEEIDEPGWREAIAARVLADGPAG